MKKITIGTLALCFALGLAANDDIETTRIKNDNSFDEVLGYWNANEGMMQKRPGGEIKKAPNGRSGSCMQITNTDKSFSALYSCADPGRQKYGHVQAVHMGQGERRFPDRILYLCER